MYKPDHKKTLKLPKLPYDAQVGPDDMIGVYDDNVATDDKGDRWYPVKWRGQPHRRRVWESRRD